MKADLQLLCIGFPYYSILPPLCSHPHYHEILKKVSLRLLNLVSLSLTFVYTFDSVHLPIFPLL